MFLRWGPEAQGQTWIDTGMHAYNRIMSTQIDPRLLHYYRRVQQLLEHLDPTGPPRAVISPGSKAPEKHILVFPGSFNPPTTAHLALLRQARKFAQRSGGRWQCYAALSRQIVDKETVARMTLLDRVVLLERVLKNEIKEMGILLLNRGLYVEQARAIREAFPQVRRLYFLLGFDKIVQILDARYYTHRDTALRELFRQARLLVAPRGMEGEKELRQLLAQPENRPFASFISPLSLGTAYRYISSTEARQSQAETLTFLPPIVQNFLAYARPYAPTLRQQNGVEVDVYARRTRDLQKLLSE